MTRFNERTTHGIVRAMMDERLHQQSQYTWEGRLPACNEGRLHPASGPFRSHVCSPGSRSYPGLDVILAITGATAAQFYSLATKAAPSSGWSAVMQSWIPTVGDPQRDGVNHPLRTWASPIVCGAGAQINELPSGKRSVAVVWSRCRRISA